MKIKRWHFDFTGTRRSFDFDIRLGFVVLRGQRNSTAWTFTGYDPPYSAFWIGLLPWRIEPGGIIPGRRLYYRGSQKRQAVFTGGGGKEVNR
jgi:hypothetical protein